MGNQQNSSTAGKSKLDGVTKQMKMCRIGQECGETLQVSQIVITTRVSTREQSIDNQESICLTVVDHLTRSHPNATVLNDPRLKGQHVAISEYSFANAQRWMEWVKQIPHGTAIVMSHADRLARRREDWTLILSKVMMGDWMLVNAFKWLTGDRSTAVLHKDSSLETWGVWKRDAEDSWRESRRKSARQLAARNADPTISKRGVRTRVKKSRMELTKVLQELEVNFQTPFAKQVQEIVTMLWKGFQIGDDAMQEVSEFIGDYLKDDQRFKLKDFYRNADSHDHVRCRRLDSSPRIQGMIDFLCGSEAYGFSRLNEPRCKELIKIAFQWVSNSEKIKQYDEKIESLEATIDEIQSLKRSRNDTTATQIAAAKCGARHHGGKRYHSGKN